MSAAFNEMFARWERRAIAELMSHGGLTEDQARIALAEFNRREDEYLLDGDPSAGKPVGILSAS